MLKGNETFQPKCGLDYAGPTQTLFALRQGCKVGCRWGRGVLARLVLSRAASRKGKLTDLLTLAKH